MKDDMWLYPECPVGNVFTSHGNYDEALGPRNPNNYHFMTPAEVPGNEVTESEVDEADGWSASPATEAHRCVRFFNESMQNDWGVELAHKTSSMVRVFFKKFDRKSRRWTKVPMYILLTVHKRH
jgi:hypothetical protein